MVDLLRLPKILRYGQERLLCYAAEKREGEASPRSVPSNVFYLPFI